MVASVCGTLQRPEHSQKRLDQFILESSPPGIQTNVHPGTFWNDVIIPNVEDYFEYKKEVTGEDGQKTWVVDRERYEGCLSSTARRLGGT